MIAMVGHENEITISSSIAVEEAHHIRQNEEYSQEPNVDAVFSDASQSIQNQVYVNREKTPFNEFINNDVLLYSSFPFLFLFGKGIYRCGTVDLKAARHMLLQFSSSFASCHRLIFLLFDQLQRHAATRVVASRVKCNPKSFDSFVEMVNEPTFKKKLNEASKNPASKESIELLKKISPHIVSCTSRIPFTSAQRSAEIMNLVAMRYFFGIPCLFITYAPDDINGLLNIRLSFGLKKNEGFPAHGSGLASAIQMGNSVFESVPIAPQDLRVLLAKGPVAAAEVFRLLTEIVFITILNTAPDYSTKRTVLLPAREPGN